MRLLPPGEFQVYDIVFRRPIYKDGQQIDPGYVTVFENGVLVQDHTPLEGGTGHMTRSKPGPFPDVGPLKLQDHGNPVCYRNIWYRPLPPCPIEGGTDGGYLTVEAATAMRKEIAAHIRQDAATLKDPANPLPELLRLAEALEYEKDEATLRQVEAMATQYVANLKQLATDQITSRMADAKQLQSALAFLARFRTISPAFGPKLEIDQIVKDKNWDKK